MLLHIIAARFLLGFLYRLADDGLIPLSPVQGLYELCCNLLILFVTAACVITGLEVIKLYWRLDLKNTKILLVGKRGLDAWQKMQEELN